MFDVRFNTSLTKKLIKGSAPFDNMDLHRLSWLLDSKDAICGCIYTSFLKEQIVFIICKNDNTYKMLCDYNNKLHIYGIEDIEAFLSFISIDELDVDDKQEVVDNIKELSNLPINGIVIIDEDKLYLYDIEVPNENA